MLLPNHLTFDPETVGEAVHIHRVLAGIVDPSRRDEQVAPIATSLISEGVGRNGAAVAPALPPAERFRDHGG